MILPHWQIIGRSLADHWQIIGRSLADHWQPILSPLYDLIVTTDLLPPPITPGKHSIPQNTPTPTPPLA